MNWFTTNKIALFFLLTSFYGQAQISFFPSNINFAQTTEIQKDSVLVTVQNHLPFNLVVTQVTPFDAYEDYAFSVSENTFNISANGNKQIWVFFKPMQNIFMSKYWFLKPIAAVVLVWR